MEANKKQCITNLEKHKISVDGVLQSLKVLERECANIQAESRESLTGEIGKVRAQVKATVFLCK